jgi:hypothetical protein
MRIGFHRAKVVDANDNDILALRLNDGAQHVATDSAKAIDENTNRHGMILY